MTVRKGILKSPIKAYFLAVADMDKFVLLARNFVCRYNIVGKH